MLISIPPFSAIASDVDINTVEMEILEANETNSKCCEHDVIEADENLATTITDVAGNEIELESIIKNVLLSVPNCPANHTQSWSRNVEVQGANQYTESWSRRLGEVTAGGITIGEVRGEYEVRLLFANRVRAEARDVGSPHPEAGITTGGTTSWSGHSMLNGINSPWLNLANNTATYRALLWYG
jgi:hypothetical protein